MTPQNDEGGSKRLYIIGANEIASIYDLPRFSAEDQSHFFSLSAHERAVLPKLRTYASRIFFILQLGYFKAVRQFFVFKLDEVVQDITWIQQTHFPSSKLPETPVAKGTRLKHQSLILHLCEYRLCGDLERRQLASKAEQVVRISSKPVFVLYELLHFLANQRIVAPGYTFMQNIVSNALTNEQGRLGKAIQAHLTTADVEALELLLTKPHGLHEITRLKKEPKDFGVQEMRSEIARGEQIGALHDLAQRVLPQLEISSESIKYYASLVGYYSVYQMRRFDQQVSFIYLLCFIYHRYQQMHDNLINCLIYQVRRYNEKARQVAKVKAADHRAKQARNFTKAGLVLRLFTDKTIPPETPFGEVQAMAFRIVGQQEMDRLADTLVSQESINEAAWQWEYLEERNAEFKRRLRPILRTVSFEALGSENPLLEAAHFLQSLFRDGKSLRGMSSNELPVQFVPDRNHRYLFTVDARGQRQFSVDRYEFLVYRALRNALEAGDVFCRNSVRYRSFEDDLLDDVRWQKKEELIAYAGLTILHQPIEKLLESLERQLELLLVEVNQRIAAGENKHIKKKPGGRWTLPYTRAAPAINHSFFASHPDIDIQAVLRFVDQGTHFTNQFDHVVYRAVKQPLDKPLLMAALIAWGTNTGLGRMSNISDVSFSALTTTSENYIRLETLRAANDQVSNAAAELPIFRYYDIGDLVHSSSDGQKFETRIHTINARHSSKYFGLKKGVVAYTLVANHLPINARIIGAHEHESHYVYDLLANNTTEVQPTRHSTDTHGTNHVNFALLHIFGYQFAPRYKNLFDKVRTSLYGFKHPSQYSDMPLKPIRKVNKQLIIDEWPNMQRIFLSLALKTTTQFIIVGKLSSYTRKNRTKRALWELDNIYRSLYLLNYIDSLPLRQNVQQAMNRGESYHQLRRAVSYANFGTLRFKTESEQLIWSECSRLITNCIIYYNATLLSRLLEIKEVAGEEEQVNLIGRVSPIAWQHINFHGRFEFLDPPAPIDLESVVQDLVRGEFSISEALN
jgi:TnpA family transposase